MLHPLTRWTILLPLSLWLTACSTHTVEPPRLIPVAPPSHLLTECNVPKPPGVEELTDPRVRYPEIASVWEARFVLMSGYAMDQLNATANCNKKLRAAQEWVSRQKKLETEYDASRGGSD